MIMILSPNEALELGDMAGHFCPSIQPWDSINVYSLSKSDTRAKFSCVCILLYSLQHSS